MIGIKTPASSASTGGGTPVLRMAAKKRTTESSEVRMDDKEYREKCSKELFELRYQKAEEVWNLFCAKFPGHCKSKLLDLFEEYFLEARDKAIKAKNAWPELAPYFWVIRKKREEIKKNLDGFFEELKKTALL
jgi:hypothetical protein